MNKQGSSWSSPSNDQTAEKLNEGARVSKQQNRLAHDKLVTKQSSSGNSLREKMKQYLETNEDFAQHFPIVRSRLRDLLGRASKSKFTGAYLDKWLQILHAAPESSSVFDTNSIEFKKVSELLMQIDYSSTQMKILKTFYDCVPKQRDINAHKRILSAKMNLANQAQTIKQLVKSKRSLHSIPQCSETVQNLLNTMNENSKEVAGADPIRTENVEPILVREPQQGTDKCRSNGTLNNDEKAKMEMKTATKRKAEEDSSESKKHAMFDGGYNGARNGSRRHNHYIVNYPPSENETNQNDSDSDSDSDFDYIPNYPD